MNLKFNNGDIDYKTFGGTFVSKKLNNEEFDYWIFCNILNLNEIDETPPKTYSISLNIVSPAKATKEMLDASLYAVGLEDTTKNLTPFEKASLLNESGYGATVYSINGNNFKLLMKSIRKEMNLINSLLGFYMDRPLNFLGATSWDFLKGKID